MQQIFEQEQVAIKEEMLKQQQKELIELAEEKKAKQEAWANRKLHVKIKDSITGKKLLTS